MHEFGIAEDILKKVTPYRLPVMGKIQKIRVKVGETLAVTAEELLEAFGMISVGTPAENAKLEVEIMPLKMKCSSCGIEFNPHIPRLDCATCGSTNIAVISGKELEVVGIE